MNTIVFVVRSRLRSDSGSTWGTRIRRNWHFSGVRESCRIHDADVFNGTFWSDWPHYVIAVFGRVTSEWNKIGKFNGGKSKTRREKRGGAEMLLSAVPPLS